LKFEYSDIMAVGIDIDGTLTDGTYNISDNGVITKGFFTRDFYAIYRLITFGIHVVIVTGSNDNVIDRKLETTQVKNIHIIKNSNDKLMDFGRWLIDKNLSFINAAFIGDAENDLKIMEKVAWCACPADAVSEVYEISNYASTVRAGHGAVYDCARQLCMKKNLVW